MGPVSLASYVILSITSFRRISEKNWYCTWRAIRAESYSRRHSGLWSERHGWISHWGSWPKPERGVQPLSKERYQVEFREDAVKAETSQLHGPHYIFRGSRRRSKQVESHHRNATPFWYGRRPESIRHGKLRTGVCTQSNRFGKITERTCQARKWVCMGGRSSWQVLRASKVSTNPSSSAQVLRFSNEDLLWCDVSMSGLRACLR